MGESCRENRGDGDSKKADCVLGFAGFYGLGQFCIKFLTTKDYVSRSMNEPARSRFDSSLPFIKFLPIGKINKSNLNFINTNSIACRIYQITIYNYFYIRV